MMNKAKKLNVFLAIALFLIVCCIFALILSPNNSNAIAFAEEPAAIPAVTQTIEVATAEELAAVFESMTADDHKQIVLTADITTMNSMTLSAGAITILGDGHTLEAGTIFVSAGALLNLGAEDSNDTLLVKSGFNHLHLTAYLKEPAMCLMVGLQT